MNPEALQRGDSRAAYTNMQLAEQWREALEQNIERMYQSLPQR